jgi:hypothetical protein
MGAIDNFDVGGSTVNYVNRKTNNGAIQTSTSHPVRESISLPYAPIPNTSNVTTGANEGFYGKPSSTELADSPLSQRAKTTGEDNLVNDGQNRM